jgi:hypothetical protein
MHEQGWIEETTQQVVAVDPLSAVRKRQLVSLISECVASGGGATELYIILPQGTLRLPALKMFYFKAVVYTLLA